NIVVANSKGILWQAPGDTLGVFGTRFQSYAIHIDSQCAGTFVSGTRHEGFDIAIKIAGDFCTLMPGQIDNSSVGGKGTGIHLTSGRQAFVVGNTITAVAHRIEKSAARDFVIIDRGLYEADVRDIQAGLVLGGDTTLYRPPGVPKVL